MPLLGVRAVFVCFFPKNALSSFRPMDVKDFFDIIDYRCSKGDGKMIERSIIVKRTAGAALSLVLAAGCIPFPAANFCRWPLLSV